MYRGHRFPPEIINYAVWLYHRFTLSFRAVDQDGDVVDMIVTKRRDRRAAKRFFRKMLKHQGQAPWQRITDKLRSYPAAHREIFPAVVHRTGQYENNRAEVSHQPTRQQERQMKRFKSRGCPS